MHYVEVYFCQQSEFGDSADSSSVHIMHTANLKGRSRLGPILLLKFGPNLDRSFKFAGRII